jgi:hypothetical protein
MCQYCASNELGSRYRSNLIAHLNQISVWIPEIYRSDRSDCAYPLVRSLDDRDALISKMCNHLIQWHIGQQTEITAAGRRIARQLGRAGSIL